MEPEPNRPGRPDGAADTGSAADPRWMFSTADNGRLVDAGFRQLRVAAAVLLVPYLLTYEPPPGSFALPVRGWLAAVLAVLALVGVNAVTRVGGRTTGRMPLIASLGALVADASMTVVFALALAGTHQDLAWFLLLIPVLEAGMLFGLAGSLVAWFGLLIASLGLDELADPGEGIIDRAPVVTQRLGVVLLVAIPGIHLAQRLVSDIRNERRVTSDARHRSHLLETVAQSSQRIGRLDAGMVDEVLHSALLLGLDIVDVCVRGADGRWRVESTREVDAGVQLPDPGGPIGCVRVAATEGTTFLVTTTTQGAGPLLHHGGLGSLVACSLGATGSSTVVLRGATRTGRELTPTMVDCFELLAGNATIALQNKRLVGELRAMQSRLHHQAFHDPLTGLGNRMRLLDELERRLRVHHAAGTLCAVMFIDLDRFKPVNDSLGHDVGNELLVNVGRLEAAVGPSDLVARIGGDEFVILVDTVDPEDESGELAALGDRVCEAISSPFTVSGNEVVISCSVGVAVSDTDGAGAAELLRRADLAMYRAKNRGKAHWVRYRADLDEEVVDRVQLENDLRRALQQDEVGIHYQAIFDLANGQVVAAESLLRWHHPTRGPQSPEVVIPIAEDSGLILELGKRILTASFDQAAAWQRALGADAPAVAVNVSPRQLFHPQFFDLLDSSLARTGVRPDGIILEITENIVGHGEDVEPLLAEVRERGVRLALDDFGQGQTSLRYLRSFPLDLLKIDKGFVQRGDLDHADRAILRSIIQMAHDLDILVIAEGIENRAQLELLLDLGCDFVQGYLLQRPAEAGELDTRLGLDRMPEHRTAELDDAEASLAALQAALRS
jgi:diguanylate cyclase (GGDEF)-like protein